MLAVDLLLDGGVDLALADVLVHRVVGKAEVVLVRLAGQAVGRRLDEEALGQTQLCAQRDDLLGRVHAERRERARAVAVDRAVADPVLGEVRGIDDDAALLALRDGIQRRHADAGRQVHLRLAARVDAHARHLVENAARAAVNIERVVADVQHVDKAVGIVDVRLHAVGHQHADDILATVGRHAQRRRDGAVLAARNADDGGLASAGLHLRAHPVEKSRKLLLCVEFCHSLLLLHITSAKREGSPPC